MPSNSDRTTSFFPSPSCWLISAMGLTGARLAGFPASARPVVGEPCRAASARPVARPCRPAASLPLARPEPAPAGVDGATYAAAEAAAPIRGLPAQPSGGNSCFAPAEAPE
eukprot:192126-Alexandrium_andersonii.AAC.1